MNDEAYQTLKEETLAAFDAYAKATKGRTLTGAEIAALFRAVSSLSGAIDFSA